MLTDPSPVQAFRFKIGATDPSPAISEIENSVTNYLLACRVESKSPKTLLGYRQRLGRFTEFTRDNNINKPTSVNSYHIRLYLSSLQETGIGPATLNAYYRALRSFFNWCAIEGTIDKDKSPFHNIKPPKIPNKLPQPFSKKDISNLLLVTSGKRFVDVRNRALILMFLDTGLRLAEMAGIQLNDIDMEDETIKVTGKGSKERIVRIGKAAQKALLRYLFLRNDEFGCLWISENRKPLTRDGIKICIQDLCRRAEIHDAKPGPHTFRHTFGTQALRNSADIREVQTLLGHSTLNTTLRYVSTVSSQDAVKSHCRFSPVDNLEIFQSEYKHE
jgi:site-specific recombinase XerD